MYVVPWLLEEISSTHFKILFYGRLDISHAVDGGS